MMTTRSGASSEKQLEVIDAVNRILDPCSETIGVPAGLADMGIIEHIHLSGSTVQISLLPTTPGCILLGAIEHEIKKKVGALAWCERVEIQLADTGELWDETRLAHAVRSRLEERRRRLRERWDLVRAGSAPVVPRVTQPTADAPEQGTDR